jgi:hypothetical protein
MALVVNPAGVRRRRLSLPLIIGTLALPEWNGGTFRAVYAADAFSSQPSNQQLNIENGRKVVPLH